MTLGFLMATMGAVLADTSVPIIRAHLEQLFISEASNEVAVLVVRCNTPLRAPLRVPYRLTGTAHNGEDFEGLSGVVRMARGTTEGRIVIKPLDDAVREGTEEIVISLSAALQRSGDYRFRGPRHHTVRIEDDESPQISIRTWTDPRFNRYYTGPAWAPSTFFMDAWITVPFGAGYTIDSIQIFVDTSQVASNSGPNLCIGADSLGTRYQTGTTRQLYPGTRVISAIATTSDGKQIISRPRTVTVPLRRQM